MKFDFVKSNGEWFEVKEEWIKIAEEEMKIRIPKELLTFYREIGYGFLKDAATTYNANRLMDPESIRDFRLRRSYYGEYYVIEEYDEHEDGKLVFYEYNQDRFLSIEMTDNDSAKIYYKNVQIADSLEDFLREMIKDDKYFLPILEEYYDSLPDDEE